MDEAERGSKFMNGNRSRSHSPQGIVFQVPITEDDYKSPYLQKLTSRNLAGKKK
jgi:hypothetical protein